MEVESAIRRGVERLRDAEASGTIYQRFREAAMAAGILQVAGDPIAGKIYGWLDEQVASERSLDGLCAYLLAQKRRGYGSSRVRGWLQQVESRRKGDGWGGDVWLNAHVLRTLGEYGIGYPRSIEGLLRQRHANGSWFNKVWVTSYGLAALAFGGQEYRRDIDAVAGWLKSRNRGGYWEAEGTEQKSISREGVTSLAAQALLLVGEGYEEEPLRSTLEWLASRTAAMEDVPALLGMLTPLAYVFSGEGTAKTLRRAATPIEFRQVQVTQVIDKVVQKEEHREVIIGSGAVVQRTNISTGGTADGSGGAVSIGEDSIVQRSQIGAGAGNDALSGSAKTYAKALEQAWSDGKVTTDEQDMLAGLREDLGISAEEHMRIEAMVRRKMRNGE